MGQETERRADRDGPGRKYSHSQAPGRRIILHHQTLPHPDRGETRNPAQVLPQDGGIRARAARPRTSTPGSEKTKKTFSSEVLGILSGRSSATATG